MSFVDKVKDNQRMIWTVLGGLATGYLYLLISFSGSLSWWRDGPRSKLLSRGGNDKSSSSRGS